MSTPGKKRRSWVGLVNRGFVPELRQDAKTRPRGQITGPIDLWFSADPQAIAAAKEIGAVAPL
jgi:cytochrome oxidase assembly protein ShyY1